MLLHLLVPGLYSRLPEWQRSYGWSPQVPGLQRLLAAARRTSGDDGGLTVAGDLLGPTGTAAGFRRRTHGFVDEPGWLCADPVYLRADVDSAILVEAEHLQLEESEARALVADLQAMFAGDGWRFEVADAVCWYALPPSAVVPPELPGTREAAGRDVGLHFRDADQSAQWKRFYAELQMVLAQSEVNRRREARGMTPVNALWFWGAAARATAGRRAVNVVQGGDAVLAGMAQAAGLTPSVPDLNAALDSGGAALVWLDALRRAAAYDDIEAFQEALAEIDAAWFAPLVQALEERRLESVLLYADGRRWDARRRRGLARWRRGAALPQALGLEKA
jgi:hypothetical protein